MEKKTWFQSVIFFLFHVFTDLKKVKEQTNEKSDLDQNQKMDTRKDVSRVFTGVFEMYLFHFIYSFVHLFILDVSNSMGKKF